MEGVDLEQFALEKQRELEFDPTTEIEKVTAEIIMPATPLFDRANPEKALVCQADECHWKPCPDCSPDRQNCDFAPRNQIHLSKRTGFILRNRKQVDDEGNTKIKQVAEPCQCHPAYSKINKALKNNEVYSKKTNYGG